jgi:hypothetical protein
LFVVVRLNGFQCRGNGNGNGNGNGSDNRNCGTRIAVAMGYFDLAVRMKVGGCLGCGEPRANPIAAWARFAARQPQRSRSPSVPAR